MPVGKEEEDAVPAFLVRQGRTDQRAMWEGDVDTPTMAHRPNGTLGTSVFTDYATRKEKKCRNKFRRQVSIVAVVVVVKKRNEYADREDA
jgi:hypothetical protein